MIKSDWLEWLAYGVLLVKNPSFLADQRSSRHHSILYTIAQHTLILSPYYEIETIFDALKVVRNENGGDRDEGKCKL
jgi:hypothetical protein